MLFKRLSCKILFSDFVYLFLDPTTFSVREMYDEFREIKRKKRERFKKKKKKNKLHKNFGEFQEIFDTVLRKIFKKSKSTSNHLQSSSLFPSLIH